MRNSVSPKINIPKSEFGNERNWSVIAGDCFVSLAMTFNVEIKYRISMANKELYSITGLFDTPEKIEHAAAEASEKGYKQWDVNTPYPVHGMDGAMKLKPSPMGYFALIFGLSGTAIAFMLIYWTMVIDYPIIIGGKPVVSLPAYVPVMFELTVLLAAVGSVAAMFAILFKFPNNSHPLHDTDYMKAVSVDKFGISIEARDKKFDETEVRNFLSGLGAEKIEPIYFPYEEKHPFIKIFTPKFIGFLITAFFVVSGGTYFALNKLMYVPPFNWMEYQHKLIAQSPSDFFKDGFGMRIPPEGTIARGEMPYAFAGQPDSAGKYLANPMPVTEENLSRGKERYLTYCSPCHGNFGKADSRLGANFAIPPSFHSEKMINEWSDGRIYHVITDGQNLMPSYAKQIPEDERWKIVLYVRALQRAVSAREEDLK